MYLDGDYFHGTEKENPQQLEGFFTDLFKQPLKTIQKQVLPALSPVLTGGLSLLAPKAFGIKGHESMKAFRTGRTVTIAAVAATAAVAAPEIFGSTWGAWGSTLFGGLKTFGSGIAGGIGKLFGGGGPSTVGPQAPGAAGGQQYTAGPVIGPDGTVYPTGTMVAPDGSIVGPSGTVYGSVPPGTMLQPAPGAPGAPVAYAGPAPVTGPGFNPFSLFSGITGGTPSPAGTPPASFAPSPYGPPMMGPGGQVYPPGTMITSDGSIVGPDGTVLTQAPPGTTLTPQTGSTSAGILAGGGFGGTMGVALGAGLLGIMLLASSTMKKPRGVTHVRPRRKKAA